jgi:hypothetical protein
MDQLTESLRNSITEKYGTVPVIVYHKAPVVPIHRKDNSGQFLSCNAHIYDQNGGDASEKFIRRWQGNINLSVFDQCD